MLSWFVEKVDAIHSHLKSRIGVDTGQLKMRLVQPEFTIATSDGIRNGTLEMRYSLIGREITNDDAVRRMRTRLSLPIDKAIYAAESCCHSNSAASRFVLKSSLEIRWRW